MIIIKQIIIVMQPGNKACIIKKGICVDAAGLHACMPGCGRLCFGSRSASWVNCMLLGRTNQQKFVRPSSP